MSAVTNRELMRLNFLLLIRKRNYWFPKHYTKTTIPGTHIPKCTNTHTHSYSYAYTQEYMQGLENELDL